MNNILLSKKNLFIIAFFALGIFLVPKAFAISLFNVCAPGVTCLTKVDTVGTTTAKLIPSYLIQTTHSAEYYQNANWWFEYGTAPSLSGSSATSHQSNGSPFLINGQTVTGLSGNTKYYARLAVSSEPSGLTPLNFKSEIVSFTTDASGTEPTPTVSNNPGTSATPTPTTTDNPVLVVDENPVVITSSGSSSSGGSNGGGGGGSGSTVTPVKKIFTVGAGKAFKISAKPADPKVKKVTITIFGKTYLMIGKKGIYTAALKAPTKLGKYSYAVKFVYAKKTVVKKDVVQVIKPPVVKKPVVKVTPKPTTTVKKVLGVMDIAQSSNNQKPWYQHITDPMVSLYHLMPWTY